MGKYINVIGQRFGKLIVKEEISQESMCGIQTRKDYFVICKCDCGKETKVRKNKLIYGSTKSCGCIKSETLRKISKKYNTLTFGEAAMNLIFRSYKNGAIHRKLSWDLSKENFKKITSSNCFYCGIEPSQSALTKKSWRHRDRMELNGDYIYNGIDRINSNLGYTMDNVVPCCGNCNVKKNKMSVPDFYKWIKRVHDHLSFINFQLPTGMSLRNASGLP